MQVQIRITSLWKKFQKLKDRPRIRHGPGTNFRVGHKLNCNLLPTLVNNAEEQKTLHHTKLTWTLSTAWKWTKENLKETFRWKLSDTCRRREVESEFFYVKFFAVLPGHDSLTHTSRATTFTSKFNAPLVSPNFCGSIALKTSQPFVENTFAWRLFDSETCKKTKFFVPRFFLP